MQRANLIYTRIFHCPVVSANPQVVQGPTVYPKSPSVHPPWKPALYVSIQSLATLWKGFRRGIMYAEVAIRKDQVHEALTYMHSKPSFHIVDGFLKTDFK